MTEPSFYRRLERWRSSAAADHMKFAECSVYEPFCMMLDAIAEELGLDDRVATWVYSPEKNYKISGPGSIPFAEYLVSKGASPERILAMASLLYDDTRDDTQ